MNDTVVRPQTSAAVNVEGNLLEQAIAATKQTEPDHARSLLKALTENALDGTIRWQKSLVKSVKSAIAKIDETITQQLNQILHHEKFSQLEGSWRGLNHLVYNTETSNSMRIKFLSVSKRELFKDLDRAVEFDQSELFKKIYENEFGMPGGEPYGLLVGDYEFNNHPEDIDMLRNISNVAAASFCPFISAASAKMMGFDRWTDLANPRDLEKIFDSVEFTKWRSFRETDDSRFVTLTMPRVLARLPYGEMTLPVEDFAYEEAPKDIQNNPLPLVHEHYCWMNAAYLLSSKITEAMSKHGWATAIRGAEGGGKVADLPMYIFTSDDGDIDAQCPSEIGITDRREAELSKLGFLPICHYKNTDYAVFFGAQSTQKAKKYDRPEATANASISARLPYIMATSRFAHFLKVMARDKIGSFMEAKDCEDWLNRWILNYVNANAQTKQELKAKYPLADAKIEVKEIAGKPGSYQAVAWLRPWLQMEELTTSMRLVAKIPEMNK